jgi:3(or 17)beta-hydroxysteroid dehydrogenase
MQQPGRVAGKVALVTGAASGIGAATAKLLAQEGAVVLCADRDLDGARAIAAAISEQSARGVGLDVTEEELWEQVLADTLADQGKLDVLVNCAGITAVGEIANLALADWRRVMAVNLEGVFLGTKHGIRTMAATGGSIVNVSSVSGLKAAAGGGAYSASKAGVCMLTRTAAKECLEAGLPIRINTVCPGGVKTPIWRSVPFFQELVAETGSEEAAFEKMAGGPKGRFAEPEEIASVILFLASDESRFMTGTDLVVDNGYLA